LLAAHIGKRVDELRRHVPKAIRGDVGAIHQARVTTRRLKAALDLLEPILPDAPRKRFARTLRRLRRTLGPSRDVDVMLGHLSDLRPRRSGPCDALDWLERNLTARRDELARTRVKTVKIAQLMRELDAWEPLARRVADGQDRARALLVSAAPRLLGEFADQSARVAALDLEKSCEPAEDVHALRVTGKIVRYMLELAQPVGVKLPSRVLPKFKRLQDALGLWHDYAALGEQVLRFAVRDELGLHRPALYGQVLKLAHACWRKSNAQLRAFGRIWTRDGEVLGRSIRASLAQDASQVDVQARPEVPAVVVEEVASATP
jgi:CHAD domain-containing protein